MLFIAGCAAEPMRVEFPVDNPVNPEANEAVFMPPPNPFESDVAALAAEPPAGSKMPPEIPGEMSGPHPHHGMDQKTDNPPDGEGPKKIPHGEKNDRHQEHPQ
jgi:hypothetical protein